MSVNRLLKGLALPVLALGLLLAPREGRAACAPSCPTASATGSITSTIMGPVTVSTVSNLAFGTLVRPATSAGNGTVAIVASTGNRTIGGTGLALASATATRAQFTVTGEGASTVGITIPSSISLSSGSASLTVTLSASPTGTQQTLSGSAGSDGTKTIYVGGSFSLTSTTASGAYSGSLLLTAAYQ